MQPRASLQGSMFQDADGFMIWSMWQQGRQPASDSHPVKFTNTHVLVSQAG